MVRLPRCANGVFLQEDKSREADPGHPAASALFRGRQFRKQCVLSAQFLSFAAGFEMVITFAVHFPCLRVVLKVYV